MPHCSDFHLTQHLSPAAPLPRKCLTRLVSSSPSAPSLLTRYATGSSSSLSVAPKGLARMLGGSFRKKAASGACSVFIESQNNKIIFFPPNLTQSLTYT